MLWGIMEPRRQLVGVEWMPDGKNLVVAGADDAGGRSGVRFSGRVDIWDAELGVRRRWFEDGCAIEGALLAADGKRLFSFDMHAVKMWDLAGANH
jgi:hypothetical protein